MVFTREDILKIQNALLQLGRKDSEFKDANTPLNSNDEIAILQDGINKKVSINNLLSTLGLLKKDDFINVSDRYDEYYIQLSEAITIIANNKRKKGLVITFQDLQGDWKIFQFDGELNNFSNTNYWKDLFNFKYPIVNSVLPDEEDLTLTLPDEDNNSFIKLKDKEYDTTNFSGMGTKIIRKNIIEITQDDGTIKRINYLSPDEFNSENTIYVIKYDFTLNEDITIPSNCILQFDGGSISGEHTITGQNTGIKAGLVKIFDIDVTLAGTWNVAEAYPEWFGAVGDNITVNNIPISKAISIFENVFLSCKNYKISTLQINKDVNIIGNNAILSGGSIYISNHKLNISGVTFKDISTNAIVPTNSDVSIKNCKFINIGITENLDPTWQGNGVYIDGGNLIFKNNFIYQTHGHGALFIMNNTNVIICNNYFNECDYRAIEFYLSGASKGIISNNFIENNGKNRTDSSGVGSNGIYGDPFDVIITGNIIKNVAENAIEGNFKEISYNIIDGTGVYDSLTTPSTEGIYILPSKTNKHIIKNNIISRTKTYGIASIVESIIYNLQIDGNFFENIGGESIYINSTNSKKISNCLITNNSGDGTISLEHESYNQDNIIKNNALALTSKSFLVISNILDYAKKIQITTFDNESLNGFTLSNGTVSYVDDIYGKKAVFDVQQYFKIYKNIDRIPTEFYYGISIRFKGKIYIQKMDRNNQYIGNYIEASSEEFTIVHNIMSMPKDYRILIGGIQNTTLEISEIYEYIVLR